MTKVIGLVASFPNRYSYLYSFPLMICVVNTAFYSLKKTGCDCDQTNHTTVMAVFLVKKTIVV